MEILTKEMWGKISESAHLFDRYGPSTAYAVCFTVNALCLLTGFPWLQENKNHSQRPETHSQQGKERDSQGVRWGCEVWLCVLVCVWGREKIWGTEGEGVGLCVETQYCKKKKRIHKNEINIISKEAWNQQTSRPAQQTAVTLTCKIFLKKQTTETKPRLHQTHVNTEEIEDNHKSSHDSVLKPF